MKRAFDILAALAGLALAWPVLLLVAAAVRLSSPGPAIHWSRRVGRGNREFRMPKFRSMRTDTPDVATHLLEDPQRWITPIGRFLRRSSLDELPQLWSVLKGDMSLVGPRPALFNQHDLVELRTMAGVERLRPGVTGWAQVNGRDELPIPEKVRLDAEYLERQSFAFDLAIILATLRQAIRARGVSH
ncbi:sugar transferase [Phenylobacterium sp.]|uniref:sugar transferase n=1 Tax=Phenylobacterium sp. TaxID=1871053 RepID=UPI0025D3DDE3|nr:sugar transferase [Phenylobacterium sp.]